jgi:antirestriction protein ArdC
VSLTPENFDGWDSARRKITRPPPLRTLKTSHRFQKRSFSARNYIQHWIAALKQDKKLIVQAAQQAQKAADLILGILPEPATPAN